MSSKFTEKAEKILNSAVDIAENLGHTYIGTEHALLALLFDENSCAAILLSKNGIKYNEIEAAIKEYSGIGAKTRLTAKDTTPRFRRVIENSYKTAQKYSSEKIGSEHILSALLDERGSTAEKILTKSGHDTVTIRDETITFLRTIEKSCALLRNESGTTANIPNLLRYGKNLTAEAKASNSDPVIGRENETDRLIRILCRKTKNNPCLIGEAGVGKTAIVEGLAKKIASGDVPLQLKGATLISIDLSSMIAGAKYRGDFEDRIKNILEEVKNTPSVILFIDEIHTIVGAGAAEGAIDAANILKPALARADIHLIGATTLSEYKKHIENDGALERRFQPLIINEPTPEKTIEILFGLKERYEKYHKLYISNDAINAAVNLSTRYIHDRFLPDKAIDVLDEACAKANLRASATPSSMFDNKCDEYPEFTSLIFENSLNPLNDNQNITTVNAEDIADIITEMTGIPIKTAKNEALDFRERLERRVIGQHEAINAVANAVARSMAGINNEARPRGVFFFVGKSGVGKTELARALALELFGSENALLRFDMSEFSEKQSVAKFIGSPPGYVGYNDSTPITDIIRKRPYSVILFDEIEKASEDVLNLFLQITDTGRLTDSAGRTADFKNSYIIMTSNAYYTSSENQSLGFVKDKKSSHIYEKLKEHFSDEFLNRLDDIILFEPQNDDTLLKIIKKKIEELSQRLNERGIKIKFDDTVYKHILSKSEKNGGARGVGRIIASEIETPIAKLMLSGKIENGASILSKFENGNFEFLSEEFVISN